MGVPRGFKHADDEDDQPPPAKQASKGHKPETDDDDKDKKSPKPAKAKESQDDDDEKGSFDVWAPFQGCQLDFQIGETYLVYAKNDESSGLFFTSSCMRTRRISDAGADLSYLYFYKSDPNRSSRLEGFTTTDRKASLTACGRSLFVEKRARRINELQAGFSRFWTSATGC